MTTLLKKGGLQALVDEPVKLVCDVVRQPLKMLDNMDERKKMELQYQHECGLKKLEVELRNRERKERYENEVSYNKAMAEIEDMIERKQIERKGNLAIVVANYQKTMAEAGASLHKLIGNMSLDLRERAHNLIIEKTKEYEEIQHLAEARAIERLEEIENKFPDGTKARDIMEKAVDTQLMGIIDAAAKFIDTMKDDLVNMINSIDQLTNQTVIQANSYLSPVTTKNIVDKLRNGNDRMIEEHR